MTTRAAESIEAQYNPNLTDRLKPLSLACKLCHPIIPNQLQTKQLAA
jgi:hypothetical protein